MGTSVIENWPGQKHILGPSLMMDMRTHAQAFATQFLSESIIVAFVALLIAMGLMFIIKPMILQLNFARIFRWDLQANYLVYAIFVVFAIVVRTEMEWRRTSAVCFLNAHDSRHYHHRLVSRHVADAG